MSTTSEKVATFVNENKPVLGVGYLGISKAAFGYAVPFIAQLGFGATLGTSAIRAALIGTIDLGVGALATLPALGVVATASGTEVPKFFRAGFSSTVYGYALQPLIVGLVYSSGQYVVDIRSEGFTRDFTFATLSAATSTAMVVGLGGLGVGTLIAVRGEKAIEDISG